MVGEVMHGSHEWGEANRLGYSIFLLSLLWKTPMDVGVFYLGEEGSRKLTFEEKFTIFTIQVKLRFSPHPPLTARRFRRGAASQTGRVRSASRSSCPPSPFPQRSDAAPRSPLDSTSDFFPWTVDLTYPFQT
jgi:hypothetical protein